MFFFAEQKYTTVRHAEGRGPDRGLAALARRGVRRGVRAHPPQRAGQRALPRRHRPQRGRAVLRAAARLRSAVAGQPAHGERAARALQIEIRVTARTGVVERIEVEPRSSLTPRAGNAGADGFDRSRAGRRRRRRMRRGCVVRQHHLMHPAQSPMRRAGLNRCGLRQHRA